MKTLCTMAKAVQSTSSRMCRVTTQLASRDRLRTKRFQMVDNLFSSSLVSWLNSSSSRRDRFKVSEIYSRTYNVEGDGNKKLEMINKLPSNGGSTVVPRQGHYEGMTSVYSANQPEEESHRDPEREADFDKAYNKLVKKFYNEQGPNLLIPEEDLHKAEQKGFDANEVQRKILEQQRKKEEKIKMIKQMQEEKELEGCTFAPQMLTKKKKKTDAEEKRDLNKFLDDQKKYMEKKEAKKNERKEQQMYFEQSVMN